jgi:hypothetical protein
MSEENCQRYILMDYPNTFTEHRREDDIKDIITKKYSIGNNEYKYRMYLQKNGINMINKYWMTMNKKMENTFKYKKENECCNIKKDKCNIKKDYLLLK